MHQPLAGHSLPWQEEMLWCSFYTEVLGMEKLPRPPFPFDGAWLQAGGMTLHLIADDPTIPRKEARRHWKVCCCPV